MRQAPIAAWGAAGSRRAGSSGLLADMLFADRSLHPEVLRRFELAELAGNTSRIAAAAPLLVLLHAGHALVLGLVGPDEGRSADWRWWCPKIQHCRWPKAWRRWCAP